MSNPAYLITGFDISVSKYIGRDLGSWFCSGRYGFRNLGDERKPSAGKGEPNETGRLGLAGLRTDGRRRFAAMDR